MAMTLYEAPQGHAFSVMDGKRCVAVARKSGCGQWVLRLHEASWIDTKENEAQRAWYRKLGLRWNCAPHLKSAPNKRVARREMKAVAAL